MKKRVLVRWLLDNGFTEEDQRGTSHRHFSRGGVKVTFSMCSGADLSKSHVSLIARHLERSGVAKAADLRREWGLR